MILLRPIEYIDALTIPDDAYLSLTIARNIAKDLGPLYSFDFTNGFQPLYVFMMVQVFYFFPHEPITPIYFSLVILTTFDTMSLFLILKIVLVYSKHIFTLIAIALCWIINPYIIKNTLNGLETMMSFFFIVLTTYYYIKQNLWKSQNVNIKNCMIIGMILGVAVLARIDNCLLVLAILFSAFINYVISENQVKKYLKFIVITSLSLLFVILPWLIYSFYYTGDFYPISGKAVRYISISYVNHNPTFDNWYSLMIQKSLTTIFRVNFTFILLIIILTSIILSQRKSHSMKSLKERLNIFNPILIFSLLLLLAYTFYIFTYWFFERYFFSLELVFILYLFVLLDFAISVFKNRFRGLFFSLILFIIFFSNVMRIGFKDLYINRETENSGYFKLALWANENFNDGTVVGSTQTGALGYFADKLEIINLDGVVNKECFEAMKEKNLMGYIKEKNIEYIIGWQNSIEFIQRESANFNKHDLIFIKKIEGIKTLGYDWYLYKVNKFN